MPERSVRALISVAVVITLAWIGTAIGHSLQGTKLFIPFVVLWGALIVAVIVHGIYHAFRAQDERLERGTRDAPKHKKRS